MTSAPSALVPVRIPLAYCLGLLLTFSGFVVAELRIGVTLGNPDTYSAPQVVALSVTAAATAWQSAEPTRAAGISRVSRDSRPHLNNLPAGVFVGPHEGAGGGQPLVVTRPGAPWISQHLVTLDNHQQFQRL